MPSSQVLPSTVNQLKYLTSWLQPLGSGFFRGKMVMSFSSKVLQMWSLVRKKMLNEEWQNLTNVWDWCHSCLLTRSWFWVSDWWVCTCGVWQKNFLNKVNDCQLVTLDLCFPTKTLKYTSQRDLVNCSCYNALFALLLFSGPQKHFSIEMIIHTSGDVFVCLFVFAWLTVLSHCLAICSPR